MSEAIVNVTFFDTTCRDGAQSLPSQNQFPADVKVDVADQVARLGVGVIEAGFPATPLKDETGPINDMSESEVVHEIAKVVGNTDYRVGRWLDGKPAGEVSQVPIIAGLCRVSESEIDTTWESVHDAARPRIHTFIATDFEHIAAKFKNKTPEQVLQMGRSAVRYARELTAEHVAATVEFSAEAASTTEQRFLERVARTMVNEGAQVMNFPDTVSQRDPFQMREFYHKVIGWVMDEDPSVVISGHNHRDLDMSTANSYALVVAAAEQAVKRQQTVNIQLETTVCNLGERAGNTDVFPLVASIFKFAPGLPAKVRWNFNAGKSVEVATAVMGYANLDVDRQNAVVGKDVYVHRSGIHSDGVIKGGYQLYTPFDPVFFGHEQSARHEDGRYQGRRGSVAAREGLTEA